MASFITIGALVFLALVPSSWAQPPAVPAVDATLAHPAPLTTSYGEPVHVPFAEASAAAVLDDFNRPDGPIGSGWTVHDGSCNVVSNAAVCSSIGRATFNSYSGDGNSAEMDVAAQGGALQYAAILLNYGAGTANLFLKVQSQSQNGLFSHAACYTGNNAAAFGLGFFQLSSQFATAHMKATRAGSDVTIEFTNIDGGAQPDQTYVCSGAPGAEGSGIGIAGYAGVARMDNFAIAGAAAPANVFGAKTVTGDLFPGSDVSYTIVLTNTGTGPQPDNPGDEFVDTLPSTLTATNASASSGTVQVNGNTITWNGTIAAGGTVTITITARIGGLVAPGTVIANQGEIRYDGAGSGSNSSSRFTDDPGQPGEQDPTAFTVRQQEPIPTLDRFGLWLLVLLTAGAATVALRRLA